MSSPAATERRKKLAQVLSYHSGHRYEYALYLILVSEAAHIYCGADPIAVSERGEWGDSPADESMKAAALRFLGWEIGALITWLDARVGYSQAVTSKGGDA